MTDAEVKLQLIRLIDDQSSHNLRNLYETVISKIQGYQQSENFLLEQGYKAMSEDKEREREAYEWIEAHRD